MWKEIGVVVKTYLLNFSADCLCRLSYHQRITEIIPSSFEKLLPLKALPYYKYEEEGAAGEGCFLQHRFGF